MSARDIFRARSREFTNFIKIRRRTMAHVVRAWRASRTIRFLVLIPVLGTTAQVILSRGAGAAQNGTARQTQVIGSERLVSVEPLAETDGEICVPEPVAANPQLIAGLQQENLLAARRQTASPPAASIPARPSEAVRLEVAKRRPASTVRDPRNAFASLVVDATRNEVIFAEENNFSVLVYDRLENTPPRAALSEPKRIIQGENTRSEEHTSELQSLAYLVCRLLLEKKKKNISVQQREIMNSREYR